MEGADASPRSGSPSPGARRGLAEGVEAYIAGDRRRAIGSGSHMSEYVCGAALFADISGFTPLTEALAAELGPQRGAEELTAGLDLVFDAVLSELHGHGGSVVSFSGDAVTCWLDGDDGSRAIACGLDMQRAMSRVDTITTPGGTAVALAMKVAVASGAARRFVVGDPEIQLIDVLAGSLMDRLADAEHSAKRAEVVVDGATLDALQGRLDLVETRLEGHRRVGVVRGVRGEIAASRGVPEPLRPLSPDVVRPWLLPAVYERLQAGFGDFLAELRPAVPMFIRFGGIDYDGDPDARVLLDDFVRRTQQIVHGLGGNVLQMTIGDKGAYLYAVFGSPLAHEDDAARACAAALEVLELERRTAVRGIQVGLTNGRLRSGASGHRHRRTFTCLGDAVNLAARLMAAAPAGSAYVTGELAVAAGAGFVFAELPELQVKGKAALVAVRQLVGRRQVAGERPRRPVHALVGRDEELATLLTLAERARSGNGQVVAIVGDAGLGKSRLMEEVLARLSGSGIPAFVGAASAVGSASYRVWQGVFTGLFGVTGDDDPLAGVERALRLADASLLARLPLLTQIVPIVIDDNEFTRSFDPKLRKTSLESLLLRYFTLRAEEGPFAVVLEDCHWIDGLSRDLLEVLTRAIATLPVLVVLAARSRTFAAPELPYSTVLELDHLDAPSSRRLVTDRLSDLYGPTLQAPDALVSMLVERAEGSPFYLEELVHYLHSEGVDLSAEAARQIELPVSLATLVLSRIDTLAESPRQTLKVASVVGREFDTGVLAGSYAALGSPPEVRSHLRSLCAADLVIAEDSAADTYAFTHAVIREVTYESLPFALRCVLHARVGAHLEQSDVPDLEALAHHYWHSSDVDKKRRYLVLAGEAAQARYANDAAVEHFRRVVPLLSDEDRGGVLLRLGAVLELRGEWNEAAAVFEETRELAERRGAVATSASARSALADVRRKQGRFEDAVSELERARAGFASVGDEAGLGRVAHLRGTVAAQRGDYLEARAQYEASLQIRRALGDGASEASLLSNLAIVAEYEEDYDRAEELNEAALDLRTALGDRWGIGVSQNNLAMIAYLRRDFFSARLRLEEALRLELEVGDLWMVAIARHNLGNATRELGDVAAARRHYTEALRIYGITGDQWAQCLVFEDVAMLAIDEQPRAALRLVGAAEVTRETIGSPRVAAQQAELDRRLARVRQRIGVEEVGAEMTAGRALGPEAAHELASELLALAVFPESEDSARATRHRQE